MELRVRLRYKSTSDFGKGDHLNFDKSLAHALEWLYDEDQFEDERTWLYCMEGVLPIYIMMSIVTDIFTFALQDYAETNIKDYILRMEEGNYKHGWNDNKPSLLYLGDEIVLGRVHTFTSEVILWATYLYVSFRADIEEDNEKLKKAKDVLYKLFWKKTGLKEEFVKDTFLMKHFDQTIRDFAMDVLHHYKDDKSVADNKPQQTPVNNKMEESVLNYISATEMRFYYEGWRNGKHGAICQWDGIYRFVEQARGKSGVLDDVKRNKDDNPIVAIGIVAYWLQFNSRMDTVIKRLTKYRSGIPKDIREQFDNYTKIRFEQFKNEHRDDPDTWDWDWEYQFYAKAIIPHEIGFNKQSEALFDYISDSDIALVRAVMNNYIKYLKKCRADKGYRVSPELLVLRAVDTQDDTKYEDLEDYEIKAILEKLKGEGYIDAMWIHGQKLPWVCKMLDKGRAYLKQLEEGSDVIDVEPVNTPQPYSEQVSTETPSQMTQPDVDSEYEQDVDDEEWDEDEDEDEVEVTPEVREYDTTYDYIFDPRVKPEAVKKTLDNITTFDKCQHPFWFVFMKVLVHLQWIPASTYTKDVLKWASIQYDLNWTTKRQLSFSDIGGDKRDMNREANEGKQKKIKDTDITLWNTISKTEFRDIEKYRKFALLLKKTFVHFIVDGLEVKESTDFNLGKPRDRVKFMKSPKNLINLGK
jgi:hypothetical protein